MSIISVYLIKMKIIFIGWVHVEWCFYHYAWSSFSLYLYSFLFTFKNSSIFSVFKCLSIVKYTLFCYLSHSETPLQVIFFFFFGHTVLWPQNPWGLSSARLWIIIKLRIPQIWFVKQQCIHVINPKTQALPSQTSPFSCRQTVLPGIQEQTLFPLLCMQPTFFSHPNHQQILLTFPPNPSTFTTTVMTILCFASNSLQNSYPDLHSYLPQSWSQHKSQNDTG
jgi:hypothetical protein